MLKAQARLLQITIKRKSHLLRTSRKFRLLRRMTLSFLVLTPVRSLKMATAQEKLLRWLRLLLTHIPASLNSRTFRRTQNISINLCRLQSMIPDPSNKALRLSLSLDHSFLNSQIHHQCKLLISKARMLIQPLEPQ